MCSQISKLYVIWPDRSINGPFGRLMGGSEVVASLNACPPQTKFAALGWALVSGSELGNSSVTIACGSSHGVVEELPSAPALSQPQIGGGSRQQHVLLVEDNPGDVFMVQEAFRQHNIRAVLHVAQDGEDAMQFIDAAETNESAPTPALVLLDLNLPKRSGTEVLAYLRRSERSGKAKVLVVTSSNSPLDRAATQQMGIIGYFLKPPGFEEFLRIGEVVDEALRNGGDS